jgi:hypothetical protein
LHPRVGRAPIACACRIVVSALTGPAGPHRQRSETRRCEKGFSHQHCCSADRRCRIARWNDLRRLRPVGLTEARIGGLGWRASGRCSSGRRSSRRAKCPAVSGAVWPPGCEAIIGGEPEADRDSANRRHETPGTIAPRCCAAAERDSPGRGARRDSRTSTIGLMGPIGPHGTDGTARRARGPHDGCNWGRPVFTSLAGGSTRDR